LLSAPVCDSAPSGTTALLAANILGLVVVDLSNPAQIKQLSQTPLPMTNPFPAYTTIGSLTLALSVNVQNGLGYVGTEITAEGVDDSASDSLLAFDIGQPTSPRLVAFRHQGGFGISVITFSGNNIFLANDGLVAQYDNSLRRNAIELFDPPVAFQWVLPQAGGT
jgi:hypothetical protein